MKAECVAKPLLMIGLISSCPDQFSSCAIFLVKELLFYMYLSQLMSTFTNYLMVLRSLNGISSSDPKEPVIQQSRMYLLIHWFVE